MSMRNTDQLFSTYLTTLFSSTLLGGMIALTQRNFNYCTDNGVFYDLMWIYAGAGAIVGAGLLLLAAIMEKEHTLNYLFKILLRYGTAYFMFSYAMSYFLDLWYADSLVMQEIKLVDLKPREKISAFLGHSPEYRQILAFTHFAAGSLLFFRQTQFLGLIVALGITVQTGVTYNLYEYCTELENGILFGSSVLLFSPYLVKICKLFFSEKPVNPIRHLGWSSNSHGDRSLGILKALLIAGTLIYFYNSYKKTIRYYSANVNSPIVGVWNLEDLKVISQQDSTITEISELFSFDALYLDTRRYGAVKVDDSLSTFEYMVDTTYNQLEFWNFHEYRSVDLKGKYSFLENDTLLYTGTNNRDTVIMKLVMDKKYQKE